MATLSFRDKAVAPCTDPMDSESRRAYLSDQLWALSQGKAIAITHDAIASTYLSTVQALQLSDSNKSHFYACMSYLVRESYFPLYVDPTFLKVLVDYFLHYLNHTHSKWSKTQEVLFNTKLRVSEFNISIRHTIGKLPNKPQTVLEWKIFFYGMTSFRKPISCIIFWLQYYPYCCSSDAILFKNIRSYKRSEIEIASAILNRKIVLSEQVVFLALYFSKIFIITYRNQSSFTKRIHSFLDHYLVFVEKRLNSIGLFDKKYFLHLFKFWLKINAPNLISSSLTRSVQADGSPLRAISFHKVLQFLPDFAIEHIDRLPNTLLFHLAAGKNIRKFTSTPIFSKKMAHIFHNLNVEECRYESHYLYCLVLSLGGTDTFCSQINTYLNVRFNYDTFGDHFQQRIAQTKEILKKFIEWNIEEELTRNRPIYYGFASHILRDLPGFSMRGRTKTSFFRLAMEYYNSINRNNRYLNAIQNKWTGFKYKNWMKVILEKKYTISQILNTKDLRNEGRMLKHCVGGYTNKCVSKSCAIYSLRQTSLRKTSLFEPNSISLVTIEVNAVGRIVQAKASHNSKPNELYLNLIKEWAEQEGILWESY